MTTNTVPSQGLVKFGSKVSSLCRYLACDNGAPRGSRDRDFDAARRGKQPHDVVITAHTAMQNVSPTRSVLCDHGTPPTYVHQRAKSNRLTLLPQRVRISGKKKKKADLLCFLNKGPVYCNNTVAHADATC